MSTRPSFLRDIGHYLSGRAVLLLLGFVTFPLLTRMLSVGDYGVLSFALRIVLLLTVLSKCGLQYSAARFYEAGRSEQDVDHRRRFHSTLLLGPALTSLTVICVYLPILIFFRDRLADPMLYRCLLLAPVLAIVRTLQSLVLSMLRNEGRSALHSVLEVAARVLTLVGIVSLFFGKTQTAFAVLCITTAAEALVFVFRVITLVRRRLVHVTLIDWGLIRNSLIFGAPLIAYELSSIVLDSGDRLLVRHFLGDTSLGFYSAAYNVSGYLQDTMMTPLNLAIFPIYMRLWNEQGRDATRRFLSSGLTWFIVPSLALIGLSVLCSHDAIMLLASKRFVEADHLLPILVPGLLLYATHIFLNVGLILEKRTVLLAGLVSFSAVTNLGLNIYLIPRIGLTGAAWATLLSYALLISVLALVNQRILPLSVDFAIVTKSLVAAIVAYYPASWITTHFPALTLALRTSVDLAIFIVTLLVLSKEFREVVHTFLCRVLHCSHHAGEPLLTWSRRRSVGSAEIREGGSL